MIKTFILLTALALVQAGKLAPVQLSEAVVDDSCEYLDNGCPADFNIHLLLPHETSCRKFYYCVNGEKVPSKCRRGSVFNPDIQNCGPPGSIDRICEDEDSSSEEAPSQEDSGNWEDIPLLPNGCPVNWGIDKYLPHNFYCNLYYQCQNGELVERWCGAGTHFNPVTERCDHPFNVGCTLPGGDAIFEVSSPIVPNPTTPKPNPDFLENGCPIDGSINWMVPHEEDCGQFYHCVWGSLIISSCPSGLHFSPTLQRCESPAVAGCLQCDVCSDESSSEEDIPPAGDDDDECTGGGCNVVSSSEEDVPPAGDDDDECTGGNCNVVSSSEEDVPPAGDDDDECTGGNCNVSSSEEDVPPAGDDDECTGGNCNVSSSEEDVPPAGDDDECTGGNCNVVSSSEEDVPPAGDDDDECTGGNCDVVSSSEEDVSSAGDDECSGDNCNINEPECPEPISPEQICAEDCNVLPFPHGDCDKYWKCDGNNPILVVCSEGLHFNPNTYTCDYACNVGCVRTTIQTTAGPDGLRIYLPWDKVDNKTKDLLKMITN